MKIAFRPLRLLISSVVISSLLACSATRNSSSEPLPAPKVGGESYDGKTFARKNIDASCADGSPFLAAIELNNSTYKLTRENCVDLNPEVVLAPSDVTHTIGESTLVYAGEVFTETTADQANLVSCGKSSITGGEAGDFACLGVWDYSQAFGGDADMCAEAGMSAYSNPGTGCQVSTPACASGTAIANKTLAIPSATPSELDSLATLMESTSRRLSQEMIQVWYYYCQ